MRVKARERPSLRRELAIGLAVFALYSVVASVDWPGRRAAAAAHAQDILALERWLHLDVERGLNAWLARHEVLRVLANYEYATTYVVSAFALLFWLWRRRPDVYRSARQSFVLLNLLGICGFVAYPLAPPRLTPGAGFVDTVRLGHTWGSWGSPLVGHANQLAAMPSLHFAWALWVSAVLARISGGRRTQVLSAVHVLVTLWVIVATANHYLLDAVAAGVLVAVCSRLTRRATDHTDVRVPGADAFFLHVESSLAPQHVGGVVLLDTATRPGGAPSRADVEALLRSRLGHLPRFRQRLDPGGRWRRARWCDAADLDWGWHVPLVDLTRPDGAPGGMAAFQDLVARLEESALPRDRPLWRVVVVHGIERDRAGVVLLVHHVVADGFGMVAQALHLLEPALPVVVDARRAPGPVRMALATAVGLAQLATDGRPPSVLPTGRTSQRLFGTTSVPLADVRALARRHRARVSDVLLTAVAGGLRTAMLSAGRRPPERVRVAVPLMVRDPRDSVVGNVTAAVMVDLPLGDLSEPARLAAIAAGTARLRTPSRALASRFAMQVAGSLPPALHAWFARTFYGPRTFSAVVSNMPGPDPQLNLVGARIEAAFPLLPLAPGVPVALGALGWNGTLCVGISVDPALAPDADDLAEAVRQVFRQLQDDTPGREPRPQEAPGRAVPVQESAGAG